MKRRELASRPMRRDGATKLCMVMKTSVPSYKEASLLSILKWDTGSYVPFRAVLLLVLAIRRDTTRRHKWSRSVHEVRPDNKGQNRPGTQPIMVCHTQQEITDEMGEDQTTLSRTIEELCNLESFRKSIRLSALYQGPDWEPTFCQPVF